MASFHSRESFLRNAPLKGNVLDINQLPRVPKSPGDQLYEIEHQYEGRPELPVSYTHLTLPTICSV